MCAVKSIKRKYFNESVGHEFVARLAIQQDLVALSLDSTMYLVRTYLATNVMQRSKQNKLLLIFVLLLTLSL